MLIEARAFKEGYLEHSGHAHVGDAVCIWRVAMSTYNQHHTGSAGGDGAGAVLSRGREGPDLLPELGGQFSCDRVVNDAGHGQQLVSTGPGGDDLPF